MSGLIEHATRWENAQFEAILNEEPKCESPGHWRAPEDHGGPGATRMYCPCGYNGIICATFHSILTTTAVALWCAYGVRHVPSELRFVEL